MTFQVLQPDGTFINNITVWAYVTKNSTLSKTETDNYFRVVIRDHSALDLLLSVGNRLLWKDIELCIEVWEKILYDRKGFVEVLCKQIASDTAQDIVIFPDIVSVYTVIKTMESNYGLTSYKYDYNFTTPAYTDIRCKFPLVDKSTLKEGKVDIEHDSLVVIFNGNAPIRIEDYIISPVHGKFKVEMIVKNNEGMIEASVDRSDIQ